MSEEESAECTANIVQDIQIETQTTSDEVTQTDGIERNLRDILGSNPIEPYEDSGSEYVPEHRSGSTSPNLQHILDGSADENVATLLGN
ncbi:unnamed protein product [Leptosia nina]|uniref:Uncharacterized protein n=1 Tax=Leptosia nina TaxID=320188 RepID=A0AAV1K2D5_9NEOP